MPRGAPVRAADSFGILEGGRGGLHRHYFMR
jgi:hypothetical protein